MFRLAAVVALCLGLSAGCARRARRAEEPAPPPPAAVEPPAPVEKLPPGLRFEIQPAEAEVIIDEKSYGPASAIGHVTLPPGLYRVSVRAKGYNTWRAEVSVGDAGELLKVSLSPRQ